MNLLPAMLFILWVPLAFAVFITVRGHRAIAGLIVGGWLFLPAASFDVMGLPDLSKVFVVNAGTLLTALVFDARRFGQLRFRWYDLIVVVLLVCPLPTSLANGLSLYDGMSAGLLRLFRWGIPYLLGRVYFDRSDRIVDLAKTIFVGGLVYIPFCLFEIRMSPSLCEWMYGFRPRPFNGWRLGGWRPNVFLEEGLELGMFMTAATLLGFGLFLQDRKQRIGGLPLGIWLLLLFTTTVLCRSLGAMGLLLVGMAALLIYGRRVDVLLLGMLLLGPFLYVGLRATNVWSGSNAVMLAARWAGPDRAHSLGYRFYCENVLLDKALQRPIFGWGGYGRSRVKDKDGEDIVETDGLWIISLGTSGFVGLMAVYATLLTPVAVAWRRFTSDPTRFGNAHVAAFSMAVLLTLYAVDGLLNWFYSPIYLLCAGALLSWSVGGRQLEPYPDGGTR